MRIEDRSLTAFGISAVGSLIKARIARGIERAVARDLLRTHAERRDCGKISLFP
jgi:hypothetical protein